MRRQESAASSWYTELDFNAPMSSVRANELIATLEPLDGGATVVDLGCGWAELLLRVLEYHPTARGRGIDRNAAALERAQRNADARGLGTRVRFECADAAQYAGLCDVAIVIGSSHAWGGTSAALDAIGARLRPGGRLLLGEGIWEQAPTDAALIALDATADDFTSLVALVQLCEAHGYQPQHVTRATLEEWDSFESRYCAGAEQWLATHPDSSDAADLRAAVDKHRDGWRHGYREILGFAYLTLLKFEDTPGAR
jgi:cyclopropane fatty-acyl-phospholipid synthase-like methyltransferase